MDQRPPFTFAFAPTLAGGKVSSPGHVEPFRRYLADALDRPVQTIVPASYEATLNALRAGGADAAMVGDYVSRHAEATGGIEQLVAPVSVDHEAQTYRSAFVAPAGSGIRDLAGLRGFSLGLVDGQSTSGFLVPRAMLREAGLDPDRDVTIRLYGSHRAVVEAVIGGEVEAGAAHELRVRQATVAGDGGTRLRILAESRPIPAGPLVVRTSLDAGTRALLADAMLHIHEAAPDAARIMLRHGHRFTLAANRPNPTLKSIAALAGVSYATVSRVINASGYVAPATAERVRGIIDELGYAPNGHARVLLGRQLPMVGLLVSPGAPGALETLASFIEPLRIDFQRAGVPFVLCPVGPGGAGNPFADLVRDKRLGALVIGPEQAADGQVAALARTGHVVVAIGDHDWPPGVVVSSAERLVDDILAAIGPRTGSFAGA
jgi:phosphonate transport system substrate-binding protein